VPGVETNESARLSTGEFSNLMCGVDIVRRVYLVRGVRCWLNTALCCLVAEILLGKEVRELPDVSQT
jgi:hypothetical protein